jgi:hypothetical protein
MIILSHVVDALRELSDESLQRRRWLSSGEGEVSSFTEAVCQLFDDSGLGDELDKGREVFGHSIDDSLRQFDMMLSRLHDLERTISRESFIEHPEMAAVRSRASGLVRQLSASANE